MSLYASQLGDETKSTMGSIRSLAGKVVVESQVENSLYRMRSLHLPAFSKDWRVPDSCSRDRANIELSFLVILG